MSRDILRGLDRLKAALTSTTDDLVALVGELPIQHSQNDVGGLYILAPNYRWGERTADQKRRQLSIKRQYEQVAEVLRVWLYDAPESLDHDFQKADKHFRAWLELQSNWSLSPDKRVNESSLRKDATALLKIIEVLGAGSDQGCVVIPDTNSLITQPDPTAYRTVCGTESFALVLLPTVLGELDKLKIEHRNPEVRDKAQRAITRIKGWRKQGGLLEGVTVDKSIEVRAIHQEPEVQKSLKWLDPNNADDRIIASVLHVQASSPSTRVILVTGDINLQNKADAAFVETKEVTSS